MNNTYYRVEDEYDNNESNYNFQMKFYSSNYYYNDYTMIDYKKRKKKYQQHISNVPTHDN